MENTEFIQVEVAYARPDVQVIIPLKVHSDATIEEVVRQSGILERFPEIDLEVNKLGVFGKLSKRDAGLHDGDRVEIYRALIADPKEVRRRRAGKKKDAGQGEGEKSQG